MACLLQRGSTRPLHVAVLSKYTGLRHAGLTTMHQNYFQSQPNVVSRAFPRPLAPSSPSVGASSSPDWLHCWTARYSIVLRGHPSAHTQHALSPGLQRRPLHASSMASANVHTRTDSDAAHMDQGGLLAIPRPLFNRMHHCKHCESL